MGGSHSAAKVVKKVKASMIGVCWGPLHNCAGCTFSVQAGELPHNPDHNHSAQSPADAWGTEVLRMEYPVPKYPLVCPAQLGILGCRLQASRKSRSGSGGEAHRCHPPEAQGLNTSVTCHLLFIWLLDILYIITDHIFSLVSLTFSIVRKGCRTSRVISGCKSRHPRDPAGSIKIFLCFKSSAMANLIKLQSKQIS